MLRTISRYSLTSKGGGVTLTVMEQIVQKSYSGSSDLSFKAIGLKIWIRPPNTNCQTRIFYFFDRRSLTSIFDLQPPKTAISRF